MRGQPKLIKRSDSPFWCIYVPKCGKQRAQRLSTGEVDPGQAESVFAQWILEGKKSELAPLEEIQVNDMLERYADFKKEDATVGYHMVHLKPYFKGVTLAHINNRLIREYVEHRASQKSKRGNQTSAKNVSRATVRRELDTLSACMGFARREGYVKEVPHIEKPKASPPRERWLTIEEYARLLAACEKEYLKTFIAIAMATSARPSSILELKWFQIDMNARLIHFNPPGRHQTHKYRPTVYINDSLYTALSALREKTTSEYVIARKSGARIASIKKSFKTACDRAGLQGVTAYTLRHTAMTWGVQAGKSLAQMGQLAGHKDPRTTMRYAKHDPSFTKDTVGVLSTGAQLAHNIAETIKNDAKIAKNKEIKQ